MKKSLILLLALVLLAGSGICGANIVINEEIDNVQLTENVIVGDKAFVDGIVIERNTKYKENMYWTTTYLIGDKPSISTDFAFYEWGKEDAWSEYYGGLEFNSEVEFYYIGAMQNSTELTGLAKALYELIEEAPAGKVSSKLINLKDYMEYYEFSLSVDIPNCDNGYGTYIVDDDQSGMTKQEKRKKTEEAFMEYFRIPVLDEEVYELRVNKSEEGEVIGYGYSSYNGSMGVNNIDMTYQPKNGDSFNFDMSSTYVGNKIYFTFSPLSYEEKVVDTSLIPGGYGVYSCEYDEDGVDASSLKLEYALEPNGYVRLKVDAQEENLLVFTNDKEQFYLTVLDLENMQEKQKYAYGKVDEVNLTRWYRVEEDYLIAKCDYYEAVVFSRNEDGTYTQRFSVPGEMLEVSEHGYFLDGENAFDWNGEMLLVAFDLMREYPYTTASCGVGLAAFDVTGLIYYAEYESSLDTGAVTGNYRWCEPINEGAIQITWKK